MALKHNKQRQYALRALLRKSLNDMNMKLLILILLIIPAISLADCNIDPEQIKHKVKEILDPLHNSFNLLITENEFRLAHTEITELLGATKNCEIDLENKARLEYKNADVAKEMQIYWLYSAGLKNIEMQLRAAYESFELGFFRPFMFKTGMWESVANEFYEEEI